MDDGSATVAVATRAPKRSASTLSTHRHHSTNDNGNRTSLIKTKIQKIDGQYKASTTCPINPKNNSLEQATHSDDQDELEIVATIPPLIENSSRYRTRTDVYDDETGDDQRSSSSSTDCSPVRESMSHRLAVETQSPTKLTVNTNTRKSARLLSSSNESVSVNEILVEPTLVSSSPVIQRRRSSRLTGDDAPQSSAAVVNEPDLPVPTIQQRPKVPKKANKSLTSSGPIAISIEQNQSKIPISTLLSPHLTIDELCTTEEDPTPTPTNNKPSQSSNDQSKVKVRLKTTTDVPPSVQTKKTGTNIPNKFTAVVKLNKVNIVPAEQKTKKPLIIPKETVIANKKPTPNKVTPVVTPKKSLPISISKPSINNNNNNSEKAPRPPSLLAKPADKKPSDTTKSIPVPAPVPAPKLAPGTLGKIPKLNPANKKQQPKQAEPTPSTSLTDQMSDVLASAVSNKDSITTAKDLLVRPRSPPTHLHRHGSHYPVVDDHDPFAPLSPIDQRSDDIDSIIGRQSSTAHVQQKQHHYPSLLDSNLRLPGHSNPNLSRTNSIGLDSAQSQSPLSPPPSSTLYPVASPPPRSTLTDVRNSQPSHPHPPSSNFEYQPQHFIKKPPINNSFSTPPVLPSNSSSGNFLNTQSAPPPPLAPPSLISQHNTHQESRTSTASNLWDSASSDEEPETSLNALRFYRQTVRAVDEELSKANEPRSTTPPPPADSRTEHLLQRQKKASLGLITANGGLFEENTNQSVNINLVEPSASADDFECVAMDLDSPKHRTQSESSDNNHTIIEPDNSNKKNTINGAVDSKVSEVMAVGSKKSSTKGNALLSNRPLKTTSMTLIDEMKNSVNPSSSSKQSVLSPRSRSSSRARSRTHSRSRSRSRSRSSTSSTSSSSSRKRHGRNRQRPSKRRSTKHHSRRRSVSSENEATEISGNSNKYPPVPVHYHHQPHHQPPWPQARQPSGLLPVPPPFGHQQQAPPLLPPPYYPPSNRPLMHHQPPAESSVVGGNNRFNFHHNHHPRHPPPPPPPPPLLHPPYYPQGPPQPLMQSTSRSHHHHPLPRYPPPVRPFDMPLPPAPPVPGPAGPHSNFNQFKYESEERLAMKRAKHEAVVAAMNSGTRRGPAPLLPKSKMTNPSKSSDQDIDQLVLEREKLLAELNEMSDDGDFVDDETSSGNRHPKRSTSRPNKVAVPTQDDEGEEGELSESD